MAWTNKINPQGMRAVILIYGDLFGPISDDERERVKRHLDCSPSTVGFLKKGSDNVSLEIALKVRSRLEALGINFYVVADRLIVDFPVIDRSK